MQTIIIIIIRPETQILRLLKGPLALPRRHASNIPRIIEYLTLGIWTDRLSANPTTNPRHLISQKTKGLYHTPLEAYNRATKLCTIHPSAALTDKETLTHRTKIDEM
jgi:hypothetical protein